MSEVNLVRYDSREAWLAARSQSIGASESAALFGLSPDNRESEFSLWAKKTGQIQPDETEREWLQWGQILEGPIAEEYARRSGHELWTPPTPWCVAVHPRLPFLTATVDRWIINATGRATRGDLEIKNVSVFNSDWKKDVPLYVQAQVQHQLAVTGFEWAVVAALIGGNKLETREIERDKDFIAELEAKAEEFWGKVQRKEEPKVDGKEATTRALKALHPNDNGETVDLGANGAFLWGALEFEKVSMKEAEEKVKDAENRLKAAIGPATFGKLPDGRVLSCRTTSRKGYTSVVKPTTYRTLRLEKEQGEPHQ